jgi:hypothetical protein
MAEMEMPDNNKKRSVRSEQISQAKDALKERIQHEAQIVLLQMIMPNQKKLYDCTGQDCKQMGGWLKAIGEKVPAKKTVGETLTEKQVRLLQQNQ